jgi:hypothetical protein
MCFLVHIYFLLLLFHCKHLQAQSLNKTYLLTSLAVCNDSLIFTESTQPDNPTYTWWVDHEALSAGDAIPAGAFFWLQDAGNGGIYVYNSVFADQSKRLDGGHPHGDEHLAIFGNVSDTSTTQTWRAYAQDDGSVKFGYPAIPSGISYLGTNESFGVLQMFTGGDDDPGQHILFIEATVTVYAFVTSTIQSTVYLGATTTVTLTTSDDPDSATDLSTSISTASATWNPTVGSALSKGILASITLPTSTSLQTILVIASTTVSANTATSFLYTASASPAVATTTGNTSSSGDNVTQIVAIAVSVTGGVVVCTILLSWWYRNRLGRRKSTRLAEKQAEQQGEKQAEQPDISDGDGAMRNILEMPREMAAEPVCPELPAY